MGGAKHRPEIWPGELHLERLSPMNSFVELKSRQPLEFTGATTTALPSGVDIVIHVVLGFTVHVVIFMAMKSYYLAASRRASVSPMSGDLFQRGLR